MTSSSPYTKASISLAVSSTSVEAIGYVWALSGLCSEQGVQDVQDPSYFLLVRIDDRDWCHLPKLRVIPITEKWLISTTGLDEIFGAHHRKIGDRQIQLNVTVNLLNSFGFVLLFSFNMYFLEYLLC